MKPGHLMIDFNNKKTFLALNNLKTRDSFDPINVR